MLDITENEMESCAVCLLNKEIEGRAVQIKYISPLSANSIRKNAVVLRLGQFLSLKKCPKWLAHYVPLNVGVKQNFMLITPRRLNEQYERFFP